MFAEAAEAERPAAEELRGLRTGLARLRLTCSRLCSVRRPRAPRASTHGQHPRRRRRGRTRTGWRGCQRDVRPSERALVALAEQQRRLGRRAGQYYPLHRRPRCARASAGRGGVVRRAGCCPRHRAAAGRGGQRARAIARASGGVGPRCCSPRELLSRSSGRVGQAEVRCVAVALARAGGVAVLGERGATSGRLGVLDAARAVGRTVVPARRGVGRRGLLSHASGRHRCCSPRELSSPRRGCWTPRGLLSLRGRARRAVRGCCPRERAASGKPRCWSSRGLLLRVSGRVGLLLRASGRHRAGRGVGRCASCCPA